MKAFKRMLTIVNINAAPQSLAPLPATREGARGVTFISNFWYFHFNHAHNSVQAAFEAQDITVSLTCHNCNIVVNDYCNGALKSLLSSATFISGQARDQGLQMRQPGQLEAEKGPDQIFTPVASAFNDQRQ